ncbi:uncharacterized protein LOC130367424 [Hyla sarda]|uniref:uncharacterized protein LOC130367424 n=1 Tax=Hyla sarda TaxID=327740 RepID=UPI0024C37F1A|nr:uncharacterized protein LOC130367424 [Hyla sarda]
MTHECDNLASATSDPDSVSTLIQTELDKGFIIGPFVESPFDIYRVSPIGLATGKFNNKKRLIYDLSAPYSSTIPSLNALIPADEFALKYSSVDEAIAIILSLGRGAWLSKADISDAFKLLPIMPQQWQWHGLRWRNLYYFATKLTFGARSSPWLFNRFASALHWILENRFECNHVIHYLDDFLLIESPNASPRDLQVLRAVFDSLGVPVSPAKTEGPSRVITFLGIELDSQKMEARLPEAKLVRIRTAIHRLRERPYISKVELQSILGMLNFAMRIIPQGRTFISRLLALLPSASEQSSLIHLDCQALADLAMWESFLHNWNGISFFIPSIGNESPMVFSDAASSTGFAAIWGNHWFAGPWPPEITQIEGFIRSSAAFELYPIVAAAQLWGPAWNRTTVLFVSDNAATVDILLKGRSRCPIIMSLARRLVWLSLHHTFTFTCAHIGGIQNIAADALSRNNLSHFFQVMPEADSIGAQVPPFHSLVMN